MKVYEQNNVKSITRISGGGEKVEIFAGRGIEVGSSLAQHFWWK